MKARISISNPSSLLLKQTALLFSGIPISLVVTLLSVLLLSYLQRDLIETDNYMQLWLGLMVLAAILSFVLGIKYQRSYITNENVHKWNLLFVLSTVIAGLLWGSSSFILFPENELSQQVLLAFLLGGMSTGAVVTLAASRSAAFCFVILALVPLGMHFFLLEGEIYTSMGVIVLLFTLVLVFSTLQFNNIFLKNIALIAQSEPRDIELLRSKRFLEHTSRLANVGGFEISLSTESIYWAKQTYFIHGLQSFINLDLATVLAFFDHNDSQLFSESLKKCENKKESFDIELTLNTENNKSKWVRIVGEPELKNGLIIGVVGAYMDITEYKKIDQLKNDFIATVSHELRTPLTSIRGSLGLLHHSLKDKVSAEQNKLFDISSNNTERLLYLINDLLDIEKIASAGMEIYMCKERVNLLLGYSIETNNSYAKEFSIEFVLADDIPEFNIEVDAGRFVQIMANLLSNAAKFSNKGSKVDIGAYLEDGMVVITVTDYGKGIPKEFHTKIFQKFSQADSSSSRHYSGTGLGLNICQSLTEKMGGEIGFTSEEGQGSCFFVKFPLLTSDVDLT